MKTVCAIAAMSAVVALTGCSGSTEPTSSPTTTRATATVVAAPIPTASELDKVVQSVLDPAVPNASKLQYIQGAEADPELPNKLAVAYREGNATLVVKDVQPTGPDTASATAEFTFRGLPPNQAVVPVVYENRVWKIEHGWACAALVNLDVTSPACP